MVLVILASRSLAMALSAVSGILFARILGPDKIGLSAIVFGALNLGVVLVNLVQAPVLIYEFKARADSAERAQLLVDSSILRLAVAGVFAVAAPFVLASVYALPQLSTLAWYIAPMVLLNACNPLWLYQALEKQGVQAVLALLPSMASVAIILVWLRPSSAVGSDLWISLVGLALADAASWYWIFRHAITPGTKVRFQFGPGIRQLVLASRWLALAAVAGYFYLSFEEQLIGYLRSPHDLGTYRSAKIVGDAVNSFFGVSSVVLFPRFIEWRQGDKQRFAGRIRRIAGIYLLASAVFITVSVLVVPVVHPLVFGRQFQGAVLPCIVLLASKCVVLISNVYSWALLADPRNYRSVSLVMLLSCVLSLVCNLALIPRYGILAAAGTVLICEVVNLVSYLWLFQREVARWSPPETADAPAAVGSSS